MSSRSRWTALGIAILCLLFIFINYRKQSGSPSPAPIPSASSITVPSPSIVRKSIQPRPLNSYQPLEFVDTPRQTITEVDTVLPSVVSTPAIESPTLALVDHWSGSQCGISFPAQLTFYDKNSWEEFWEKAMGPYLDQYTSTQLVEFGQEMVVGVFAGEKPLPAYEIEIVSTNVEKRDADPPKLMVR